MIGKIQLITVENGPWSEIEQVQKACEAGADWIQMRIKKKEDAVALEIARRVREITNEFGAKLILNDRYDWVGEVKADGVHLGGGDLHPQVVRNLLGKNKIIGCTVNNLEMAKKVSREKVADYVGVGPFKNTLTKENLAPVLTDAEFREIREELGVTPGVVIGGITPEDLAKVKELDFYGIAVASSVMASESLAETFKEFQEGML